MPSVSQPFVPRPYPSASRTIVRVGMRCIKATCDQYDLQMHETVHGVADSILQIVHNIYHYRDFSADVDVLWSVVSVMKPDLALRVAEVKKLQYKLVGRDSEVL